MLNFQAYQLMHTHEDGSTARMVDAGPHDSPAREDEERTWLHGGRILRCTQCNEEVVIGKPGATSGREREGR